MNIRAAAEKQAKEDIAKTIDQLLVDIYAAADGEQYPLGTHPVQAGILAQKLAVGMMAKVALSNEAAQHSNDKLQGEVRLLTYVGVYLAGLATLFAGIQTIPVVCSWFK